MSRGRIYISGTGRAGTTFLISLLTEIGLDTGFSSAEGDGSYYETARAGLEKDIFDRDGPAIIKSPFLCDHLDEIIALGMSVSHIIIPVRNFQDAAKSREFVQRRQQAGGPDVRLQGACGAQRNRLIKQLFCARNSPI